MVNREMNVSTSRNSAAPSTVMGLVKHRQENNARVRWLSDEEEVRLRAYLEAACPQFLPELDLALHAGMRRGEMYSLAWEGVNLSRKVLTIPRSKNGEMRHATCPSTLPLNSAAISALEAFRKRGDGTGKVIHLVTVLDAG